MRVLRWATSAGPVVLTWPEGLSADDARDALDAVRLASRAIERLAARPVSFAEYEAVLREAVGEAAISTNTQVGISALRGNGPSQNPLQEGVKP